MGNRPALRWINTGAEFDQTRRYRYLLWREWTSFMGGDPTTRGRVLFVLLNPSTADEHTDDPTIRRCLGFARRWGYGALDVCNLFTLRATNAKELWRAHVAGDDVIGERNDAVLYAAACRASMVVAGWGIHGPLLGRDAHVLDALRAAGGVVHCLGLTKSREPRHPLFVPYREKLVVCECRASSVANSEEALWQQH